MGPGGRAVNPSRRIALLAAALVVPLAARAQQVPFVTTDELKRMVDAKEDFVLADALSPIEFAEERIAGSVNLPVSAIKSGAVKLPADKAKKLVFYCKGPKCTKSQKAAGLAVKMGYRNVAVYNEGIPEWVKRGYPAELKKVYPAVEIPVLAAAELKGMLDAKANVFVLDLRDDSDAAAGKIPGSVNIDLEELDTRLAAVPKGKKVVVVDLHGKQTQIAGRFLRSKGYEDVARLDGGFVSGWLKAGYPFAK
jgi:rhodanese-related sulfurtransferase